MRTIRFGNEDVPVLHRRWRQAAFADGYRMTYRLRPGERWSDAPVTPNQFEALVDLDGRVIPVGVAIAGELIDDGATWAFSTEMWGGLVLLDHKALCVECAGPVAELVDNLRKANGGSLAGLPVVIGSTGTSVLMREAKRTGLDQIQPQQHRFATAARGLLGKRLDLAVVEWGWTD